MATAPFAAQAETWNIYGWQNHSWEFVDLNGRNFDRISGNAANIGFSASMGTGMNDISVTLQCEQFTMFSNEYAGGSGWCNRNSKIGLSHPQMGEIMFATWLLPYNEAVAQWVDPFYDAGSDSHTSIMGSVGAHTAFYNPGQFESNTTDLGPDAGFSGGQFNWAGAGYDTGFNRRQEQIIQYWSPNWNGFVFRFAWTAGQRDETISLPGSEVDPIIRSASLAYENGPFWGAITWQDHEDWTADAVGDSDGKAVMAASDAESIRIAGRYIADLGDGASIQISAMWEDLEYEFNGVVSVDAAMSAFGYSDFINSYDLVDGGEVITAGAAPVDAGPDPEAVNTVRLQHLTYGVWHATFGSDAGQVAAITDTLYRYEEAILGDNPATTDVVETNFDTGEKRILGYGLETTFDHDNDDATSAITGVTVAVPTDLNTGTAENPLTKDMEFVPGNTDVNIFTYKEDDKTTTEVDESKELTEDAQKLKDYLTALTTIVDSFGVIDEDDLTEAQYRLRAQLQTVLDAAATAGIEQIEALEAAAATAYEAALEAYGEDGSGALRANRDAATTGSSVKVEREAWMVSGKIKFGGPVDFRFSYMEADDLEVSCSACSGDWDETAADAWNVGLFYTMPAGTELRLTYSEVDNDKNGTYGQGISTTGLGVPGNEVEMFAVGIVHWFD